MDAQKLENFDFELVSPERKLMSKKAWQVTIPGYEGDFGVRAGHASLVSSIRAGVVEIVETIYQHAPTSVDTWLLMHVNFQGSLIFRSGLLFAPPMALQLIPRVSTGHISSYKLSNMLLFGD